MGKHLLASLFLSEAAAAELTLLSLLGLAAPEDGRTPLPGRGPGSHPIQRRTGSWRFPRPGRIISALFVWVLSSCLGVLPAADFEETNHHGIVFVRIPAGSFTLGTADAVQQQLKATNLWSRFEECERPARKITLSRPFFIGKFEVTQKQWAAVMGAKKKPSAFKGDDLPVESVSWEDVQAFIAALNKQAGKAKYRLPTEAEWEYCCRAGSAGAYGLAKDGVPITAENLGHYAWFNANADNQTHPVGAKQPNAWGLHDLHGNVWEWCQDWYERGFYATAPATDPVNKTANTERVFRGGSWFLAANNLRAAYRSGNLPDFKSPYVGFRLVREP